MESPGGGAEGRHLWWGPTWKTSWWRGSPQKNSPFLFIVHVCVFVSWLLLLLFWLSVCPSLFPSHPSRSKALPNSSDSQWAPGPQSSSVWTSGPRRDCGTCPPVTAAGPYAGGPGLPKEQCHVPGEGELRPALPGESCGGALMAAPCWVCGGTLGRSTCQSSFKLVPRFRAPSVQNQAGMISVAFLGSQCQSGTRQQGMSE